MATPYFPDEYVYVRIVREYRTRDGKHLVSEDSFEKPSTTDLEMRRLIDVVEGGIELTQFARLAATRNEGR